MREFTVLFYATNPKKPPRTENLCLGFPENFSPHIYPWENPYSPSRCGFISREKSKCIPHSILHTSSRNWNCIWSSDLSSKTRTSSVISVCGRFFCKLSNVKEMTSEYFITRTWQALKLRSTVPVSSPYFFIFESGCVLLKPFEGSEANWRARRRTLLVVALSGCQLLIPSHFLSSIFIFFFVLTHWQVSLKWSENLQVTAAEVSLLRNITR